MLICDPQKCTGCACCSNACNKNAITMKDGLHGFLYPLIDSKLCVNCGLCMDRCPVNNEPIGSSEIAVYAAVVKRDSEREKCSSGGIFTCLAQKILKEKGSVFGAIIDENMVVRHIEVRESEGIEKIRGSKYVQSSIGDAYKKARNRLNYGAKVLFSGTPCQIAGLKNYLNKEYDNLITVDLLCHGVSSPKIFDKYVKSEEQRANSKMTNIIFRSKIFGWKKLVAIRNFENMKQADWPDTFVPGFLKNYYLRESCYNCQYANTFRQGDITLGDYWGYYETSPDYIEDDDKGISLVIINSHKGEKAFKHIKRDIIYTKRDIDDAKRGNTILSKSTQKPIDYEQFWECAKTMTWEQLCDKFIESQDISERVYLNKPFVIRHIKHKYVRKIRHVLSMAINKTKLVKMIIKSIKSNLFFRR